jgi:hypothetical protein
VSGVRKEKSEARGQKPESGSKKPEVGEAVASSQLPVDRGNGYKPESGGQKTVIGSQKSEVRYHNMTIRIDVGDYFDGI